MITTSYSLSALDTRAQCIQQISTTSINSSTSLTSSWHWLSLWEPLRSRSQLSFFISTVFSHTFLSYLPFSILLHSSPFPFYDLEPRFSKLKGTDFVFISNNISSITIWVYASSPSLFHFPLGQSPCTLEQSPCTLKQSPCTFTFLFLLAH